MFIESVIHEFDPWFNFRSTKELVEHGFYAFLNWFDQMSWYPLGRVVGGTVYPGTLDTLRLIKGIMVTAALMHKALHAINFHVDIREVCVFLAPIFSAATAYATYLFTSEIKDKSAGAHSINVDYSRVISSCVHGDSTRIHIKISRRII